MRTRTTLSSIALLCVALLASLVCARPARAQDGAAAGARRGARASISGRVVGDGGEPLAQVSVFVLPRASARPLRRPRMIGTDDEGNFVAPGLDPGVYHVSVLAPGYVPDPEQLSADNAYRPGDFAAVRMIRGGVITGVVTDAGGAPLAALAVRVFRVRDHEGRPPAAAWNFVSESLTDDRGVYRVYGLPPGGYVVAAVGGAASAGWGLSPYEGNAPTFYPSGTRDTAAEVAVRAGQETAGVDIRYREERGHRVTGTFALPARTPDDSGAGVSVSLNYAGSGMSTGHAWAGLQEGERVFSFEGVADGDYEVQAQLQARDGVSAFSPPQRVAVRGADVTGLKLALAPLASVSGTVLAEAAPEAVRALPACKGRPAAASPQETLVVARRDPRAPGPQQPPPPRGQQTREASPDEAGAFTLRHLEQGVYRFAARPLDENFYVRSIHLPPGAGPAAGREATPGPLAVGNGQQLSGLSVRLAAGAASAGGVVAAEPGAPALSALRVYLVPAERERADETLRYAEATPTPGGSFAFRNLAPGRYLLVVRAAEAGEARPRPAFWDADARARLRRDAEAAALALDLQPCQHATDLTLRYPHK